MSKGKEFQGPIWMREPLPDSDRVKYVDRETVLKRLADGEKITFNPDYWGKVAPNIYFEKDNRLLAIRRNTFESLKNKKIIKRDGEDRGFLREKETWSLNNKHE